MPEHQLVSMYLQNKQESGGGVPVASPMPKSDLKKLDREKNMSFLINSVLPSMVSPPLLLWRRVVICFSWEVGDFLPKLKGKVTFCSRVMTCSSL